jgi:threonine/homoserine/homoserine lactone efflux protein
MLLAQDAAADTRAPLWRPTRARGGRSRDTLWRVAAAGRPPLPWWGLVAAPVLLALTAAWLTAPQDALRGLLIGFSVAAPIGPMGLLCIRRTLERGRAAGVLTGLAAATVGALYAGGAGLGLAAVSGPAAGHPTWCAGLGGLAVCLLGVKLLTAPPATGTSAGAPASAAAIYASAVALALTNPVGLVAYAAHFATWQAARGGTPEATAGLMAGVFTGSTLWWVLLSCGVERFRARLCPRRVRWVNRTTGALLAVAGLGAVLRAVP